MVGRPAGHAGGRAVHLRRLHRQGPSALQRSHEHGRQAGEDRRAQREIHLQRQGQSRNPADHRADADRPQARLRQGHIRQDHAEAADRQRPLYRRQGAARTAHRFQAQSRLLGQGHPVEARLRQFRPGHHRIFPQRQRQDGSLQEEYFTTGIPPVVNGFLFNTRLSKFANPVVRRALGMLYDFEWANKNLFGGKYTRTMSFWQNSELSALGHPADDREKALLAPYPGRVPPDVMDGTWRPPVTDGSGQDRKVLKAAFDLLKAAGYHVQDGKMLDPQGNPLSFEILTSSQDEERLAAVYQRTLEKIGIDVGIRTLDGDQIQSRKQRYEFEVLIGSSGFNNSLSPGSEQVGRWGSV